MIRRKTLIKAVRKVMSEHPILWGMADFLKYIAFIFICVAIFGSILFGMAVVIEAHISEIEQFFKWPWATPIILFSLFILFAMVFVTMLSYYVIRELKRKRKKEKKQ